MKFIRYFGMSIFVTSLFMAVISEASLKQKLVNIKKQVVNTFKKENKITGAKFTYDYVSKKSFVDVNYDYSKKIERQEYATIDDALNNFAQTVPLYNDSQSKLHKHINKAKVHIAHGISMWGINPSNYMEDASNNGYITYNYIIDWKNHKNGSCESGLRHSFAIHKDGSRTSGIGFFDK